MLLRDLLICYRGMVQGHSNNITNINLLNLWKVHNSDIIFFSRALVRVAREAQRLSQNFGFCSKHEVAGAFRIVLSTPLADACIKVRSSIRYENVAIIKPIYILL